MSTRNAPRRLELIAREVAAEGDLPDDPDEAADYVARQIMLERPDVKYRSALKAAADVIPGASPPLTEREQREALEELDRRSVGGRARAAAEAVGRSGRRAGRRAARRASRAARRFARAPELSNPFRGASTLGGLFAQAFGLTVLYWLLRNPEAIERVTSGATRVFAWISSPGGVPVPEAARIVGADGPAPSSSAPAPRPGEVFPAAAERWRGLIARYFPPHAVPKAMAVMWCESRGNPNARNPTSGAGGLFQHLPRYWAARAAAAGFPGASIYNPEANVAAAAWLWRREGWAPWECA